VRHAVRRLPTICRAAIDWAEKENTRDGSPLKGKIAMDKVAVMGQSCGGFLSIALGADPRVKMIGVFNSGVQRPTPGASVFYFAGPGAAGGASGLPGDPTNSRLPSGRMKFLPTALFVASFA
jgi:hypothetical protein